MNQVVSVIGLGYVGLPVAMHFATKYQTIGFDINVKRIHELQNGFDRTFEYSEKELKGTKLQFTTNVNDIAKANFHIVTVPTPINHANQPDLENLISASQLVGAHLKKGDIVVYESTVYPGLTEEVCLPILESKSNLKAGTDFKIGYSPERINPGDKVHSFDKIKKIVSAQDKESLSIVSQMYSSIISGGVYEASSIKVAEAAKVIENTQRDLNIALMNELAIIFDKMGIDTKSVLEAAGTKWNFINFKPGLVGGHCIGVDPYYLTHKAETLGYHPEVILSGRRINDNMSKFITSKTVKLMVQSNIDINNSHINLLGLTFKENCPDLRNSKVFDIFNEFKEYGIKINIQDSCAHQDEILKLYNQKPINLSNTTKANVLIIAVAHEEYKNLNLDHLVKDNGIIIDIKGILDSEKCKTKGWKYWRL